VDALLGNDIETSLKLKEQANKMLGIAQLSGLNMADSVGNKKMGTVNGGPRVSNDLYDSFKSNESPSKVNSPSTKNPKKRAKKK
jgi:hypothetical protein